MSRHLSAVMAGLVPAIDAFLDGAGVVKTWMPATSAGMTTGGESGQHERTNRCVPE
jgi:hypothetical protein